MNNSTFCLSKIKEGKTHRTAVRVEVNNPKIKIKTKIRSNGQCLMHQQQGVNHDVACTARAFSVSLFFSDFLVIFYSFLGCMVRSLRAS